MAPFEEHNRNENEMSTERPRANQWLMVAVIALLAIAAFSMIYGIRERGLANELKEQAVATNSSMNQLQTQVSTMTAKLQDMTTAQNAAALATPRTRTAKDSKAPATAAPATSPSEKTAPAAVASAKQTPAKHSAAKRHTPADKRYADLKTQLDEQQKQLKETQEELAKNRAELEGSLSSTRDELNGSIAKTHEELVALEKRGERTYSEFDLSKSKQFQRFGPLTLSLRKADTKHKNYDLFMIVNDNELSKKKVNLYEPIWIHTESGGQSVQVVVNKIEKNKVHGYVSAPKSKESDLAALSSSSAPPSSDSSQAAPTPQQ
jgi:DNA repair exonuclease SbcCD ATPase subunit